MIIVKVAEEFSKAPGPRTRQEGPYSAEQFVEELLQPRFKQALESSKVLLVDLDGGYGYATSFLEEAFGGLARRHGIERVKRWLKVKSNDEPYLADDINRYIQEAFTGTRVA